MKKLKLDLDDIQVVSFASETLGREKGTVDAHETDPYYTPVFACAQSVGGSCDSCPPNDCPPMPGSKEGC